jgi:hypothetical protein
MPTIFAENPSQKHRTQELGTYFNIMQTRAKEHFLLISLFLLATFVDNPPEPSNRLDGSGGLSLGIRMNYSGAGRVTYRIQRLIIVTRREKSSKKTTSEGLSIT